MTFSRVYMYNSAWGLTKFDGEEKVESLPFNMEQRLTTYVRFNIELRRHYQLQFLYFYVPNLMISVINTMQFLLPCDEETKKIPLGVMLILIYVMYLRLSVATLPSSSRIPLVG